MERMGEMKTERMKRRRQGKGAGVLVFILGQVFVTMIASLKNNKIIVVKKLKEFAHHSTKSTASVTVPYVCLMPNACAPQVQVHFERYLRFEPALKQPNSLTA